MNGKLVLAVALLATVAAVSAQHARHCQAPAEFEAHIFQMDPKESFFRRGHFAYDSREERTSMFEEVRNGTDDEAFHVIALHREHRLFRYNLKTKTCTSEPLNHRFHRIEIPRNATFDGEAIIGTNAFNNAGLLSTFWNHENKQEQWSWHGVYTAREIGCIPVSDEFHDQSPNGIGRVHSSFFDVVLGIADPNIFIPNSACPHMKKSHKKH